MLLCVGIRMACMCVFHEHARVPVCGGPRLVSGIILHVVCGGLNANGPSVLICLNVCFSVGGLFRKNEYRCGLVGEGLCCGILILDVFHSLMS